jgi:methylated-DNA-[protein]-cysteine S-methyltransferase
MPHFTDAAVNAHQRPIKLAVFSTEIGWVAMLGTGKGVTSLTFGHGSKKLALADVGPEFPDGIDVVDWDTPLIERIRAYALGTVDDFRDVDVDPGRQTDFQSRITKACRRIPYGNTATYGQLARQAGSPNAARAVGNCMANNPIPLLIPCHRVVGANGQLGGFSAAGGTDLKRRLLEMESGGAQPAGS